MATTAKLSTKGFEKYLEAIANLAQDVDAAAAQAVRAGAEVLQDGMQERAPVDTYNLQKHIQIKGPLQDGNYVFVEVGVIRDRTLTDEETARYANAQEYGTSSMSAHPYVRPTIDNDRAKARSAMIRSLRGWLK